MENFMKTIELETLKGMSLEEINNALRTLNSKLDSTTQQYNKVVEQNRDLQGEVLFCRQVLTKISKNQDCVCSLDGTCQPQRMASNALVTNNSGSKLAKDITEFLIEMSSQDNRGAAFPYYYTVADEKERFELNCSGEYVFDTDNAEFVTVKDIICEEFEAENFEIYEEEVIEEILESVGEPHEDGRIEAALEARFEHVQRFEKELDTYYEGVFLTQKDAEEYLESAMNHHFGPNPRVITMSMSCWSRHTKTQDFFADIFKYFSVKVPPEMYYEKKDAEKAPN